MDNEEKKVEVKKVSAKKPAAKKPVAKKAVAKKIEAKKIEAVTDPLIVEVFAAAPPVEIKAEVPVPEPIVEVKVEPVAEVVPEPIVEAPKVGLPKAPTWSVSTWLQLSNLKLGVPPFVLAGALHAQSPNEELTEAEVRRLLSAFLG